MSRVWCRCDALRCGRGLIGWLGRREFPLASLGGPPVLRPIGLQARIRRNVVFRTRMLPARSRWGAWGAGPILSAASFSHSPSRSPALPGWVEATASVAVALSDVVRGVPVSARLISAGGQAHARSVAHTSALQSLMRTSYVVFCL